MNVNGRRIHDEHCVTARAPSQGSGISDLVNTSASRDKASFSSMSGSVSGHHTHPSQAALLIEPQQKSAAMQSCHDDGDPVFVDQA